MTGMFCFNRIRHILSSGFVALFTAHPRLVRANLLRAEVHPRPAHLAQRYARLYNNHNKN